MTAPRTPDQGTVTPLAAGHRIRYRTALAGAYQRPDIITPGLTAVFLAVVRLHAYTPVTVRGVAAHLDIAYSTVWNYLKVLRDAGLITWVPGTRGTIRPTVRVEAA